MTQDKVSALLGRPLTSTESNNFDLYLKIARESLEEMLCTALCDSDDPKVYDVREGYRTVFIDIFTDIEQVKVDDEIIDPTKYSLRQWDKRSGAWFNSIVFEERFKACDHEVEVSATWGFSSMPSDLQLLTARIFDLITRETKLDREINSKKVEDFTVSFNHSSITMIDTLRESFVKDNAAILRKYKLCDVGNIQHGKVCRWNQY